MKYMKYWPISNNWHSVACGSGKTWFGQHWITDFRENTEWQNVVAAQFPGVPDIDEVLDNVRHCVYVFYLFLLSYAS